MSSRKSFSWFKRRDPNSNRNLFDAYLFGRNIVIGWDRFGCDYACPEFDMYVNSGYWLTLHLRYPTKALMRRQESLREQWGREFLANNPQLTSLYSVVSIKLFGKWVVV